MLITLVNQLHGLRDNHSSVSQVTFGRKLNEGGVTRTIQFAINRAKLLDESNGFKVNNRVIFRVDITTHGDVEHNLTTEDTWTPPETWRQDMASLLASGDGTDVEIYVPHRTFHAHSPILGARSPYLKGMLEFSTR